MSSSSAPTTADALQQSAAMRESQAAPIAPAKSGQPYPPTIQAWYCVFVLALAVMINFLDRGILTLLVEPIKADFHLTDMQMSLIMGFAFTFFYAILGLPVARLVDRYRRGAIMATGIAIWSVMTAMCGLATGFWHLFLARVGVGVGETTSGPSAYSLLSDYFPPAKLPRAIAAMNLGFVAGSGLAMIVGGAVIGFVGAGPGVTLPIVGHLRSWQLVLMMVGLPGLVVSMLMLTVREPPRRGDVTAEPPPIGEVFAFLRRHWRLFLPMFLGLALRSSQMFGVQMWGPAFFSRTYGWTSEQIGYVSGFSLLVTMPIGLFLGSWLSERLWRKGYSDANVRVVVLSTIISIPLSIAAPLMPSPWIAAGMNLVNSIFLGMAAPVENAALQIVTPNRMRGQVTFLFLFIMNVIGMGLGPLMLASLTQYVFSEADIRYSIALTGLLTGPAAAVVFWLGMKPYGRAVSAGELAP